MENAVLSNTTDSPGEYVADAAQNLSSPADYLASCGLFDHIADEIDALFEQEEQQQAAGTQIRG